MSTEELMRLADEIAEAERYNWAKVGRPEQQEPEDYATWVIQAGRGFGKGRAASETVRKWCEKPNQHIAVIGQKFADVRDINFGGPSGLVKVIPSHLQAPNGFHRSLGDTHLVLTNGSIIRGFSSENPDSLRGHAFDGAVLDEWAAYSPAVAQAVLDQVWFCLREAATPRVIIPTTPRRVTHVRELLKRAETDPSIVITRGRTSDNTALSAVALAELNRRYAGTKLGRQELDGELLDEVEGALFGGDLVSRARALWPAQPPTRYDRIVVGFDPSGSQGGDACGIMVVGLLDDIVYVIADYTVNGTPETRFEAGCRAAYDHGASQVWCEYNYGGDMNLAGLRSAWRHLTERSTVDGDPPKFLLSTLRGDKARRAEPVVAIYEQARARHAPDLDELEAELQEWTPNEGGASPNRLDSLTIAVRALTDKHRNPKAPAVPRGTREGGARRGLAITQRTIVRG
jgi:phage terminase large subunit-like protein